MALSLNGFPRTHRLLASNEFKAVFDGAQWKAQSKEILILGVHRGETQGNPRLGLVVGKKSAKKAVQRNSIKRVVRESFRTHKQALNGLDLIVLTRPGAADLPKQELRTMVDTLWGKLKPNRRKPSNPKPKRS